MPLEQEPQDKLPETPAPDASSPRAGRRPSRASSGSSEPTGHAEPPTVETPETRSSAAPNGGSVTPPPAPVLQAERLLDEALMWGAAFGAVLTQRARRLLARAREEVEDLFAEAEATRSRWRGQLGQQRHSGQEH